MMKILNLKLVILLEYQEILLEHQDISYVPNWSEEDLMIKKFKNIVPSTHFISDLNAEEIHETFYEK